MDNINKIYGIDSLYYFCESNGDYDNLFLDILDQLEDQKGIFEKKDIEYQNSDINITINSMPFNYLGKSEGFYWFKDTNSYFKLGFKDFKTNRNLNDIRVQLLGVGIYIIGIKSLINLINDLLKEYITGYNPVTRVDLNCFVQYDLSFINKDMFVTRKRTYSNFGEIGTSKELQTLYIGKAPFLLRLYNKKEELKKSDKHGLMNEHFLNNGFDLELPIWNIEFEMHRTHLKQFNIKSIDDLLSNANQLFKQAMDDIRLISIDSVSNNDLEHNKYKAESHPLWEDIKNAYDLKEFLQNEFPLERLKRKITIYDESKFEAEIVALLRRAFINDLPIAPHDLDGYYYKAKNSLTESTTETHMKKSYEELPNYINPETGKKEKARILEDGTIIKPVNVVSVNELQDYDLIIYLDKLTSNKDLSDHDHNLWKVAYDEAMKRKLIPVLGNNPEKDRV